MPEDHFEEVRAALMNARGDTYKEDSDLTFWSEWKIFYNI